MMLTRALRAEQQAALHFTLVHKGAAACILFVGLRKTPAAKIKEAKAKLGTTTATHGRCFAEAGKLVFQMRRQAPPAWKNLVKKQVRAETGLTVAPEFRQDPDDDLLTDDGEPSDTAGETVETAPTAAEAEAELGERRQALVPEISAFLANRPGAKDLLPTLLAQVDQQVKEQDWAGAHATLDQVETVLEEFQGPAPTGGSFAALQQARLLWAKARQFVQGEMQKLEKAILNKYQNKPEYPQVVAGMPRLFAPLTVLDERLLDKLDEALNADPPEQRASHQAAARKIIEEYTAYVNSNALLADIDDNGLVDVKVRATLVQALELLSSKLV